LKYEMEVLLRPLDIVVSVKAAVIEPPRWTIAQMAEQLEMDVAQVFRAARHASIAQLLTVDRTAANPIYKPHRSAFLEFLIHGVKFMSVPVRGPITRGMPTAHAAPVLSKRFAATSEPVPVWPTPEGKVRGESFEPLHRCVPKAAKRDERFYGAMALIDAIRGGRARDRAIAARVLPEILGGGRD
jgi:hypothetical protein